jgi:A/G-specific adenine glycosylase
MELGAIVCTPRAPRCDVCPVRTFCGAYAAGTQEERPLPRKSKPLPQEHEAVAVVERDGRLLLAQRPAAARLGGLWEFPSTPLLPGESPAAAAERGARERLGVEIRALEPLAVVDHTFTHVKVRYHAVRCAWTSGEGAPRGYYDRSVWVTPEEVDHYALPLAQKRIAALRTA